MNMIAVLIVVVIGLLLGVGLFCYILGWKSGRSRFELELAEIEKQKELDKKFYEGEKLKAKKEIFGNEKKRKKKLGKGSNRERFNTVNDSLRNKN